MNSSKVNKTIYNLEIGDVVVINSPIRLAEVHLKKGYISSQSYDDNDADKFEAYGVTIDNEGWFVLASEIEITNEKIDVMKNMTNEYIKVYVDDNGKSTTE